MAGPSKSYSLLPFLYFSALAPEARILVITDRPERAKLDFTFFPQSTFFSFPANCKKNIQDAAPKNAVICEFGHFPFSEKFFSVVVLDVDLKTTSFDASELSGILIPDADLIVLDRSNSVADVWRDLFRNYGIVSNNRQKIYRFIQNLEGDEWRSDVHFFVDPHLEKPQYLVRPAFKTAIPTHTRSPLKRWLITHLLYYLRPRETATFFSRGSGNSMVGHVICKILGCRESGRDWINAVKKVYISTTDVLMLQIAHKNKNYYIRFPFSHDSMKRIRNNERHTKLLYEHGFGFVPRPVTAEEKGRFPYYVEEGINALSIEQRFPKMALKEALQFYEKAQETIGEVHRHFGESFQMQEPEFEKYLGSRLTVMRNNIEPDSRVRQVLRRTEDFLRAEFFGKEMMHSFCHGDFKLGNCLFDEKGEIIGVIDWDMSSEDDLTLVDISSLLAKALRDRYQLSMVNLLVKADLAAQDFLPLYHNYFLKTKIQIIPVFPAMLYYWIDRVSKQITYNSDLDESWLKRNFHPVINRLASIL